MVGTQGVRAYQRVFVRITCATLLFFGLLGAGPCETPAPETPEELTIFHTNDLHSHFHAQKTDPFHLGGLARLSTLLKKLRAEHKEPTLTLDAGDFSEGNWYYNLDLGANMLKAMDLLQYDVGVVGNHDFLNGPTPLLETVQASRMSFPLLSANIDTSGYERGEVFKKTFPPYVIVQKGNLKIGVIGLTTFEFAFSSYFKPVIVSEPIRVAQQWARELRPQVDVLIVLSHNNFPLNLQIAKAVLGIDAVVSGHEHKKVSQAVLVSNAGRMVPVVETGSWGSFLGELKFKVFRNARKVEFVKYELRPVFSDLPEDPEVAQFVELQDQRLNALAGRDVDQVVASLDVELDHFSSHRASLGDLATKAYRNVAGSDLALEMMSLTGIFLPKGDLTVRDLHDVMPHIYHPQTKKEWTVKVWNALGKDIQLIVHAFYTLVDLLPFPNPGYLAADGMEVVMSPLKQSIATDVKVQGKLVQPQQRYRLALTDGLLLALQMVESRFRLGLDLTQVDDTGVEGSQAVIGYAEREKHMTEETLREGGRSYASQADPAIHPYGIDYQSGRLVLTVVNEGLEPTKPIILRCFNGKKNDWVGYETDTEAPYEKIGEAEIASLPPGQSNRVEIPWSNVDPGYWPVRCEVVSAIDGYAGNSIARRVLDLRTGVF